MEYTITFKEEMEDCNTPDEMKAVIDKLFDSNIDSDDKETAEVISEYKAQIVDYYNDMKVEQDARCNRMIDNNECELYKCIKGNNHYKEGEVYYIKIDDVKSKYLESVSQIKDRLDPKVIERINNVEALATVIVDNGIGSLKESKLFTEDKFEDYFEKY